HLCRLGVGAEVRVGISVPRSVEMVIGLLAIMKAGAAYVPLGSEPPQRLAFMMADAGIRILLTRDEPPGGLGVDGVLQVPLDSGIDRYAREPAVAPVADVTPKNLVYVIYTSGSTGQPKGVLVPHASLCNRLLWMQGAYRLGADDRVLQKTPAGFDVSVWELF